MRTGSNFLEELLNAGEGIKSHGELFNLNFVGKPKQKIALGIEKGARDHQPMALLEAVRQADGLNGFRYFADHDPRVLGEILSDPTCAKIVLSRNPLESYVSLKIARRTGQWRMGDGRTRLEAKAQFRAPEFERYLDELREFYGQIQHGLQANGQTAFCLTYEDLRDPEVMSGLFTYLGTKANAAAARMTLPQNPEPLLDKVENPAAMKKALAASDPFRLTDIPLFEPRRGPAVRSYVVAGAAPLMFMPIQGGPTERVSRWLTSLGATDGDLGQAQAREWMRAHQPHRRFTVVRAPLRRAFAAYEALMQEEERGELREQLGPVYQIRGAPDGDSQALGGDFARFLKFLKANLAGQTPFRTDPSWASQAVVLQGFGQFAPPDAIIRENRLQDGLAEICSSLGLPCPPLPAEDDAQAARLATIEDIQIRALCRQAYARDYLLFGALGD